MQFHQKKVKDYPGHRNYIQSLDWNCLGNKLVSASQDGSIRLWSLDQKGLNKRNSFRAHEDFVEEIKWHPTNANIFASTSYDKYLKIWDIRVKKLNIVKEKTMYDNHGVKWNS